MRLALRRRRAGVVPYPHPLIVRAAAEAQRLGHGYVGTEHVLLACVADVDRTTASALRAFGVTYEDVREDVLAAVGARDASTIDPSALATIGIDFEEVRRAIEDRFGAGAIERTCAGRPALTRRVKRAFDEACRATSLSVADEDVLLAILRDEESLATRILRGGGVGIRELAAGLARARGEAA